MNLNCLAQSRYFWIKYYISLFSFISGREYKKFYYSNMNITINKILVSGFSSKVFWQYKKNWKTGNQLISSWPIICWIRYYICCSISLLFFCNLSRIQHTNWFGCYKTICWIYFLNIKYILLLINNNDNNSINNCEL